MKNRQTEAFPHAASQLTFFLSRELKDRTAVKGTRVAAAAGSAGWVERTSVVTVRIMMKDFFGHPRGGGGADDREVVFCLIILIRVI